MAASRVASALKSNDQSADATGAWSKRLAQVGVHNLAAAAHTLQQLTGDLATERTDVATQVSIEMQSTLAKLGGAAARAQALRTEALDLHTQLTSSKSTAADAEMESVHTLAQVKQRMVMARDVLLAAEAWSTVETDVSNYLDNRQWERAAECIAKSRASLANFDAQSAYVATRIAVLDKLLDMFERAVAEALLGAIVDDDASGVARCAALFRSVDRSAVFAELYLDARSLHIRKEWAASQDFARMLHSLERLITSEKAKYAERLPFDSPSRLAATTLSTLAPPITEYVASLSADLDALVGTFEFASNFASTLYTTIPHDEWLGALAAAFAPAQRTYASLEAGLFNSRWAAETEGLSTELDRVWVRTSSTEPGTWATCVGDVATLIATHKDVALHLINAASSRMLRFTSGGGAAALVGAAHASMLEPVFSRVHAAIESLRMRYVRYSATAAGADDADADDIADWDVVRASISVVRAAHALSDALSRWQRDTVERGRAALSQNIAAHGTLPAACLALMDSDALKRARGDGAALDAALAGATASRAERILASAQGLVLDVLLSRFRQQLDEYREHGAVAGAAAPSVAIDTSLRMPSFSKSPSEAMSRLGEGLLNMPRLLEAFVEKEFEMFARGTGVLPHAQAAPRAKHRSVSATLLASEEESVQDAAAPEHVLAAWLRAIAMTLVSQLCSRTLPSIVARAYDRAQLATDVDYLGTISAALNAPSTSLREWAQVLAAESIPAQSQLRHTAAYASVYPRD
ncbi:hypothetical protein MCUN1_003047 [Malassezia cuniculi]|uniref:Conserved oligomeric Golgi complex subunit 7 n=1 Tax=Malassezia cuniculi TaxID=948313 RepID=A0AAF0ESU3_9BASI|nr:hypothetical protein MCUN1_003047 [Malassezia cuniculi]